MIKAKNKKLLFCLGTRPEIIKVAPVIYEARKRGFETYLLSTGQHRDLLKPFLEFFSLEVDFDLDVFSPGQGPAEMTSKILKGTAEIIDQLKPDLIFVQGDTNTTFASALGAFYCKIPVAHIEAGLRTGSKYSPFPEEVNRLLTTSLADLHFCPTESSRKNLEREGLSKNIYVTGNTSIDGLKLGLELLEKGGMGAKFQEKYAPLIEGKKVILLTCHRRENFGSPLKNIFKSVANLGKKNSDVSIIFPVHLNPNVQETAKSELSDISNVHLIKPLPYHEFIWLMKESFLILTDSGGLQEEAPSLNIPVVVLRESTERPEGVEVGTSILVDPHSENIEEKVQALLDQGPLYESMAKAVNPYGNGLASQNILNRVEGLSTP